MADITLAEFNGRVWLVGGEAHIDALLANTLSKDISIELVACERKSDVRGLWAQNVGEAAQGGDPWMIHPAIVERIRRSQTADQSVFFTQWSVALDADAQTVVASAASWAQQNAAAPVVLVEYLDPEGPQAIADLSRLRMQMIEDRLLQAGVARARIERERRAVSEVPGMGQESQRIDVVVRVPVSPPPDPA